MALLFIPDKREYYECETDNKDVQKLISRNLPPELDNEEVVKKIQDFYFPNGYKLKNYIDVSKDFHEIFLKTNSTLLIFSYFQEFIS